MTVSPSRNSHHSSVQECRTPPPRPKLCSPEAPGAPRKQGRTEGNVNPKCSPVHVSKGRLFEIPVGDRAVQFRCVPIALPLRPREPVVDDAKDESQVLLRQPGQQDTYAVEDFSFKMQEFLVGGAGLADRFEIGAADDAQKRMSKQEF